VRNKRETFLICTADLQILKNHDSTYTNCRLSNTTPNSPSSSLVAAAARSSPFWSSSSADNMSDPKKASERAFREEVLIWNKIQTTHTHTHNKRKNKKKVLEHMHARENKREREASSREREREFEARDLHAVAKN